MNQDRFEKIKAMGHWVGMCVLLVAFLLSIKYSVAYIILGLLVYWVLNYWFIRRHLESKLHKNSKDSKE